MSHFPGVPFRRFVTLLLLMVLVFMACRLGTPSATQPITGYTSPFPTVADPSASPQPADQSSMTLTGTPPIPANLTHYTLRVIIDYPEHTFSGYTQIDYTNTETETLKSLFFRLYPNLGQSYGNGPLIVYPAIINGQQAETKMSMNASVVEVNLPSPLAPGDKVQVNFESKGFIPVDFGSADSASGYGMYNYSQGVLALANFYPQLAVYEFGRLAFGSDLWIWGFGL